MREAVGVVVIAVCGAGGLDPSAPVLGALVDTGIEVVQLSEELELGAPASVEIDQLARDLLRAETLAEAPRPAAFLSAGEGDLDLAAALVAAKQRVPLVRMAAGLRGAGGAQDVTRGLVDRLADLRICPDPDAQEHLRAEGLAESAIVASPDDAGTLARLILDWLRQAKWNSQTVSA